MMNREIKFAVYDKLPLIVYRIKNRGRRDRVRMIVRFITTYAISAYHH
jgi:hypothetical protein